jgi:ATP-dependent Clp protease protease subunit
MVIPYVVESGEHGETRHDLYSRLLKDRIVFLGTAINAEVANIVIAQLLFLSANDPSTPIKIYINSPGGVITAGMAIYDTMQLISCPVETICIGMSASMGAILLSGGEKGMRKILPNSTVMIHQPLGGASGQASDIEIAAERIVEWKRRLNVILSENTGQSMEQVKLDTDRDRYLNAEEALAYGIVDEIIGAKPTEEVTFAGTIEGDPGVLGKPSCGNC